MRIWIRNCWGWAPVSAGRMNNRCVMPEFNTYLEKIIAARKKRIDESRLFLEGIRKNTREARLSRYGYFKKMISSPGKVNLIAEIKKASPSKGLIREEFGVAQLSRLYREAGASALSVLTEQDFFLGRPDYVRIAADFDLPVLAKDFFIDDLQIYEAYSYGAKAILLIMAILDDDTVRAFLEIAGHLDMDCLVEVHEERELDRAVGCGAEIIGVNSRDLKTFEIDLARGCDLVRKIPDGMIRVAESGIATYDDVARFQEAGAHAVLIGEAFMSAPDVKAKVSEVMRY